MTVRGYKWRLHAHVRAAELQRIGLHAQAAQLYRDIIADARREADQTQPMDREGWKR